MTSVSTEGVVVSLETSVMLEEPDTYVSLRLDPRSLLIILSRGKKSPNNFKGVTS